MTRRPFPPPPSLSLRYEQLANHVPGEKRKPPKVRPPIEQVEAMHDEYCAQDGNGALEPCVMWKKRPPKSKEL